MDINKKINQIINLILHPKKSLKDLEKEKVNLFDLIIHLAIVGIPVLIGLFIGHVWYWHASIHGAFLLALILYIASIIGVIIGGFILNAIAPNFGVKQDQMQFIKLFSYAATPFLLTGIANIYPVLPMIVITLTGALYSFYIFYLGIPIFMKIKKEKIMNFFIVSIVIFVIGWAIIWGLWLLLDSLLGDMLWGHFYDYYYYDDMWHR